VKDGFAAEDGRDGPRICRRYEIGEPHDAKTVAERVAAFRVPVNYMASLPALAREHMQMIVEMHMGSTKEDDATVGHAVRTRRVLHDFRPGA
jgi:hypothetical protein